MILRDQVMMSERQADSYKGLRDAFMSFPQDSAGKIFGLANVLLCSSIKFFTCIDRT